MNPSANQPFKDYFAILGVSPQDEEDRVKSAYRELAFQFHPDRNTDLQAHQTFLDISEAYRVLTNPELKRRYLHRYFGYFPSVEQDRLKQAIHQRQEMTRQKRAGRYRSGRYTQQVKYRGASSSTRRPFAPNEAASPAQRSRHRTFASEEEDHQIGLRLYGKLMQLIAILLLLFCGGMWADFAFSEKIEPEQVRARVHTPRIFIAAQGMKIKTNRHSFLLQGEEARMLPVGREVTLSKSPFARFLTHVTVEENKIVSTFRVLDSPYGSHFWAIFVVMFFSLAVLVIGKATQGGAYLGTINVLVSISLLSLMFSV